MIPNKVLWSLYANIGFVHKNRGLVTVDSYSNIYFASYYAKPMKLQLIKQPYELYPTNENSAEERTSFTELRTCRYKTGKSILGSTLAIGTDYFAILAFPPESDGFASFVIFWKLKEGNLEQARWFKFQENVQSIRSLHGNWLVVNGQKTSHSPTFKTFVYNLQETCHIGISTHLDWDCYLAQYDISNSIQVLVPVLDHSTSHLKMMTEQIDIVTSFQKHVVSWPLDQTWKNVSISSCKIEPYANSFIVYTNESQSKLVIGSLAGPANAQTTSYSGALRCVSSMDARVYIEDENNRWYIIDLKSMDKTYIGNISLSASYLGMAMGKYIIVSCRNIGFFVIAERRKKLTELCRILTSSSADDVDDIAIIRTKPDCIEIMDFSGLIDGTA
jgi:hypothetical protein